MLGILFDKKSHVSVHGLQTFFYADYTSPPKKKSTVNNGASRKPLSAKKQR